MMLKLDQLLKILLKSTAVHTLITKIKNTRMCGQWKYFLKKNPYYFFQIWTSVMSCVEWNKKEDLLQDQALRHLKQVNILGKIISNLFVTSKNETTKSPIHEFKELHKSQRAFQNPFFILYYFLFITVKNNLNIAFSF